MNETSAVAPIRNILAATDFGDVGEHAVNVALQFGAAFHAKVTIFHASWLPPSGPVSYESGLDWPTDAWKRRARAIMDRLVAEARGRYADVESMILEGEPREQILEAVRLVDADLLVVGTHGRRGLSRAILGSVAERTVRTCPVPVLTVSLPGGSA